MAEQFAFNGVRLDVSGKISAPQVDIKSKEELVIEKSGTIAARRPALSAAASDESLEIRVPRINNKGTIFSNKNLAMFGTGLENLAGVVMSGGDMTFNGLSEGKVFGGIDNRSGQIISSGKMNIAAGSVRLSPIEIPWVAKAVVRENIETRPVSVACKGSDRFFAATETIKTQGVQSYTPALISAKGGIDFQVWSIVNILSRIESAGDVWMDEKHKPQIALDAIYTATTRTLTFQDITSNCRIRTGRRGRVSKRGQCIDRFAADVVSDLVKDKCEVLVVREANGSTHECIYVHHSKGNLTCKNVLSPHPASMVYNGNVYGKAASMRLSQWAYPCGQSCGWIPTLRGDTTWRKEQITAKDQIIPIEIGGDVLDLLGSLRIAPSEESKPDKSTWSDSAGYAGIKSVLDPLNTHALKTLDPAAEFTALNFALARQTGYSDINPRELLKNSVAMVKQFSLKAGQCPTDKEIEAVTVPFLCSGWRHFTDGRPPVLAPIAILPKWMVAESKSRAPAQFQGEVIDLTVTGRADIDGTIRAIKDKLNLKAKDIVLKGLAEGKDVSLKADNTLLLESIRDIATGQLASRAKVKAQGGAELHSGKEITSISSEIVGNNVLVRSDGVITVVPLELFSHFQNTFKNSAHSAVQYEQCKKYLGNEWTATGGEMKISAAQDAFIKGGSYKAGNTLLSSDKGKVDVEGLREECLKLVQKESGGLFWSKTEDEQLKTRNVINTNFEAANTFEIKSAQDTNLRSVDVDANKFKVNAGGHFKFESDKSSVNLKQESSSGHFFSSGDSGTFYLFGAESRESNSYDETVKESSINTQRIDVTAQGAKLSGVNLNTYSGTFNTPEGASWSGMTEEHSSSGSKARAGLILGGNLDEGEATFSVNLGGSLEKDHGSTIKQQNVTLNAPGGIRFESGSDVKFTGVHPNGKFQFAVQNLENHGVTHRICLDGELWSASVGFKVGAKSRLTRALANIYKTAQTKVEIVEHRISLGFKVLEDTVNLVTGILLPYEFGIWVAGEAEANKNRQCFDAVTRAKGNFFAPKGEFALDVNANQGIWFDSIDYKATSARLKAKSLNVTAMKSTAESHEWSSKVSGEVNIQGVGVPGASAAGGAKQGSSTTWHTSQLNVDDQLRLDILETATLLGAQVTAGELFANVGTLVLKTLQNRMQATAGGANISIDPTKFDRLSKLLTGGGASGFYENKEWVSDVTYLVGTKVAEVIVKDTITLVGAVIANAEKDANGNLIDKENLKLSAAKIFYEDLKSKHHRFGAGLGYSAGIHQAVPGTFSGDFTAANVDQITHATIGKGNVTILQNPDDLGRINRDIDKIQEVDGIDIQPIRFYLPLVSPDDLGTLWAELAGAATHPVDHVVRTFKRNMQGMTWFVNPEDWTPEHDTRLRRFLERVRVVGEKAADDPEIKATEADIQSEMIEAVKNGDDDRQKELEIAQKNLEEAKFLKAAEMAMEQEHGAIKVNSGKKGKAPPKLLHKESLERAKRFAEPTPKAKSLEPNAEIRGFASTLSPEIAKEFNIELKADTKLARERIIFLEQAQRYLKHETIKQEIQELFRSSRELEKAGDLEGAISAVDFKYWRVTRFCSGVMQDEYSAEMWFVGAARVAWAGAKLAWNGSRFVLSAGKGYVASRLAIKEAARFTDLAKAAGKSTSEIASALKGAKGKVGKEFEEHLSKAFGNTGSFFAGEASAGFKMREFDGAIGNIWYEAKSVNYWANDFGGKGFAKFMSDMGERLKIASMNGKEYILLSNSPISENAKQWLGKNGIKFFEILE